jgi:thiol:disulfide interchange protein DsbD
MRLILVLIAVSFFTVNCISQNQVKWTFSYDSDLNGFKASAEINEGWHLYSQHIDNEIGPVPTSFNFEENSMITLVGSTKEPESLKEYDENFEGELNFFKDKVEFVQELKFSKSTILSGSVTFMVCNSTMCLPPKDIPFKISLDK